MEAALALAVKKAGPKKKRAKAEEELIRQAIEENRSRGGPKGKPRRAGKVRSYRYKEAAKPEPQPAEERWRPYERNYPFEFGEYEQSLPEDLRPFAVKLYKAECPHSRWEVVTVQAPLDPAQREQHVRCHRCWYTAKQQGRMRMLYEEWMSLAPEGYDHFDWGDLFTKDKTLWRYIYEEAEHALVSDVLGEE